MIVLNNIFSVSILILLWFCDYLQLCLSENLFSTPIHLINYYATNDHFDQAAATDPKHFYTKSNDRNNDGYSQSSKGHAVKNNHKHNNTYDKLKKTSHDKNKDTKDFEIDSGNKEKDFDELVHYGKHKKKEKGQKSAKFNEKEGHKKGHKTRGYHNKFFKDEYGTIHKIYADDHASGGYNNVDQHHGAHSNQNGGYTRGNSHNSGYQNNAHGINGHRLSDFDSKIHSGVRGANVGHNYYNYQRQNKRNLAPREYIGNKPEPIAYIVF